MNTTTASLRGRIDRSPKSLGLAIGDTVLIGLFVLAGEVRHYSVDYLFDNPGTVVDTAIPFYVGWALAALAFGAYSRTARETPKRAALTAAGTWVVAALVGQALRATSLFHGEFAVAFLLVSLGVGLALLVPWRVVVSLF